MTVFIDTAVIMYAAGAEHPLKQPSAEILRGVAGGGIPGVTSAEVIQEIVHRFVHAGRPHLAVALARSALRLFSPVIPIGTDVVERLPGLIGRYPSLSARDLMHVATCMEERIEVIVSPDRGFDAVSEVTRLDPADPAVLAMHG